MPSLYHWLATVSTVFSVWEVVTPWDTAWNWLCSPSHPTWSPTTSQTMAQHCSIPSPSAATRSVWSPYWTLPPFSTFMPCSPWVDMGGCDRPRWWGTVYYYSWCWWCGNVPACARSTASSSISWSDNARATVKFGCSPTISRTVSSLSWNTTQRPIWYWSSSPSRSAPTCHWCTTLVSCSMSRAMIWDEWKCQSRSVPSRACVHPRSSFPVCAVRITIYWNRLSSHPYQQCRSWPCITWPIWCCIYGESCFLSGVVVKQRNVGTMVIMRETVNGEKLCSPDPGGSCLLLVAMHRWMCFAAYRISVWSSCVCLRSV